MPLTAHVLKNPLFAGCANSGLHVGISSTHDRVTVVNADGPVDEPYDDAPPVILETHVHGCLRLVPAVKVGSTWRRAPGSWQAGGAYVASSDGRFGNLCERLLGAGFYGAVALHDRTE